MKKLSDRQISPLASRLIEYETPSRWKSIGQLADSTIPFLLIWYLAYLSLDYSYALSLILAAIGGALLIRISMIQHDCGHSSFFRSERACSLAGVFCSLFTLTPLYFWQRQHAVHHARANSLDRGGGGIFSECMTVERYRSGSVWQRLTYRVSRYPLIYFFVLGPILMTVLVRVPSSMGAHPRKVVSAVVLSNSLIVGGVVAGILLVGAANFLMIHVPIIWFAGAFGLWLDFVGHKFKGSRWFRDGDWDPVQVATLGTSYLKLPRGLHWLTGNVGFHYIHHLHPRIPNYHLEKFYRENPQVHLNNIVSIRDGLGAIQLCLWDEERGRLVSPSTVNR